ncbi:MAG: Rap1a/Tai family immunity protein [Steroidobacteraceae bacterium]
MQTKSLFPLAATLCFVTFPVQAAAPPSASQLRADCKAFVTAPGSAPGGRCAAYIQGFLDGSAAASKPLPGAPAAAAKPETFAERAARTRVRGRDTYPPRASAAVCVAASVPTAQVVAEVNAHLDTNPPAAGDSAASAVHTALLAGFPCKPAPR